MKNVINVIEEMRRSPYVFENLENCIVVEEIISFLEV